MSIIQEDLHEIVHVDISVVYAEEGRNEAFSWDPQQDLVRGMKKHGLVIDIYISLVNCSNLGLCQYSNVPVSR